MAKKRSGSSEPVRERLMKVYFSDEEIQQIRVAAAIADQSPGVFARCAAIKDAERVEEEYVAQKSRKSGK